VRDPKPGLDAETEVALGDVRHLLGFLKQVGFLKPGAELEDRLRYTRTVLALNAVRAPHERELPNDVLEYLLQLVFEKALAQKGRPSTKFRDRWVLRALAYLVAQGLTPTRNRSPTYNPTPCRQQPTACEMVAGVLAEFGINLTEASVEAIWSQRPNDDVLDETETGLSPKIQARARAWLARIEAEEAQFEAQEASLDAHLEARLASLGVREK
jgi:hypothetical protein